MYVISGTITNESIHTERYENIIRLISGTIYHELLCSVEITLFSSQTEFSTSSDSLLATSIMPRLFDVRQMMEQQSCSFQLCLKDVIQNVCVCNITNVLHVLHNLYMYIIIDLQRGSDFGRAYHYMYYHTVYVYVLMD